jgi:putative membrane protein
MIYYDTEAKWYKFVFSFFRLSSVKRAAKIGLFFAIYTALIRFAFDSLGYNYITSYRVFEALGAIFTLLTVMRTTQSYNRWWEARKTWGALVNNCRNLAIYLNAFLDKSLKKEKDKLSLDIANFTHALAFHLRDEAPEPMYYECSTELNEELEKASNHPIVFAQRILDTMTDLYREEKFDGFQLDIFKSYHQELMNIQGINERIKKAPIPFSYVAMLKMIIFTFGFIIPFQRFDSVEGFMIPIWTFFIMSVISLIEIIGAEIEDPFEERENDLPLQQMANVITKDVFNILGQHDHQPRSTEMKEFHKVI